MSETIEDEEAEMQQPRDEADADEQRVTYFVVVGKIWSENKLRAHYIEISDDECTKVLEGVQLASAMTRQRFSFRKPVKYMQGSAGTIYRVPLGSKQGSYDVAKAQYVGRYNDAHVIMHWHAETKEAEARHEFTELHEGTSTQRVFDSLKPVKSAMRYMSRSTRAHMLAAIIQYLNSDD